MGGGLAKLNELKRSVKNTIAFAKGEEPELGFLGSPPIKFPATEIPVGCAALDLRASQGKIPEVTLMTIYECLDEFKNDGSYRFAGVEMQWRCKTTGVTQKVEHMSGEKDACRKIEVGSLDYIVKLRLGHKEHEGVNYISFCGVECHLHEPAGCGDLKLPLKECKSENKEFTEGALGFRLIVHKKLKVIVDIIPFYARVSDKRAGIGAEEKKWKAFLKHYDKIESFYGTKIYDYKVPENKYEDFATVITSGKMEEEYLGGLPLRLLCNAESVRFNDLRDKTDFQPVIDLIRKKGSLYNIKLEPAIEDRVVNFVVKVLLEELFNKEGQGYENSIRFCMKMLCIVYNSSSTLWKKVNEKIKTEYDKKAATLFDKAMAEAKNHHTIKDLQKFEEFFEEEFKQKGQKACPGCPDDGTDDNIDVIAKKYMLDAANYIQEYHGFFKTMFHGIKKNYGTAMLKTPTTYHGAPTVKGLDRIKAKVLDYQAEELKKTGNKLSNSDACAKITDFLRGTVECHDLHELYMAYLDIKRACKANNWKIVKLKNKFKDMEKKEYKSLMLSIMIYNTQIAELQMTIYAFKKGNDLNHFIYEIQREHNLYDIVCKNLNLATAFKEWLEPVAPVYAHEIWPQNRDIKIKGYMIKYYGTEMSKTSLDPKDRTNYTMNLRVNEDNKVSGSFVMGDKQYRLCEGECKIIIPKDLEKIGKHVGELVDKVDGKTGSAVKNAFSFGQKVMDKAKAVNNKLAEVGLTEKQEDPVAKLQLKMVPIGQTEKKKASFNGVFCEDATVEGEWHVLPLKEDGKEDEWAKGDKGRFRLWVDDGDFPGLNQSSLAFREVMKTSTVMRKKYIPSKKAMEWKGALKGSLKNNDEALSLSIKVENPLNFPYTTGINGKGKCGKESLRMINGFHTDYETAKIYLYLPAGSRGCFDMSGPRTVICSGRFLEDLKIAGVYDDNGQLGRFYLDCVDKDAIAKFGPKPESEKSRFDLIIIYQDGVKHYCQTALNINPDHNITGSGWNIHGELKIEGKQLPKGIEFTKTQTTPGGEVEVLSFDGNLIANGLYEGQFRSKDSWGKFKLKAC